MAVFVRTLPDATWMTSSGYTPTIPNMRDLDVKIAKSVNGDRGGTWNPTTVIRLDGKGINVTGPMRVDYGGKLTTKNGARFIVGGTKWPLLGENHTGRKRTIVTPCIQRQSQPNYHWVADMENASIRSIACTVQIADVLRLEQPRFQLPLRVHDGATLASVDISFRIPIPRSAPPVVPPHVRIVRISDDGVVTSLISEATGADVDGYIPFKASSSGPAWYNGGNAQTFAVVCDQNNVVDTSKYIYWAELIEEVGTLEPIDVAACDGNIVRSRIKDVVFAVTSTQTPWGNPNSNTEISGAGLTIHESDRILLTKPSDILGNGAVGTEVGVWIVATTTGLGNTPPDGWSRVPDLAQTSDFTPYVLVYDSFHEQFWECAFPSSKNRIKLFDPGATGSLKDSDKTPITFRRRTARGNIYHAMSCNFENIVDMRPQ